MGIWYTHNKNKDYTGRLCQVCNKLLKKPPKDEYLRKHAYCSLCLPDDFKCPAVKRNGETCGHVATEKNSLCSLHTTMASDNRLIYITREIESDPVVMLNVRLLEDKTRIDLRHHKDYMDSYVWKNKRNHMVEKHNHTCQRCGNKRKDEYLNLHHLNYERLGCEKFSDVILLCMPCHTKEHGHLEK